MRKSYYYTWSHIIRLGYSVFDQIVSQAETKFRILVHKKFLEIMLTKSQIYQLESTPSLHCASHGISQGNLELCIEWSRFGHVIQNILLHNICILCVRNKSSLFLWIQSLYFPSSSFWRKSFPS